MCNLMEKLKMKPINKKLGIKYETIRITPDAKKLLIARAINESARLGRMVSLVEAASTLITDGCKKE